MYTFKFFISPSASKNVYHLNLEIRNYNSNPIQVQYRQAGTSQFSTFNVAPLYHHWFYFAFQLIDGYPMSVQFRVYDTKQRRYLSMHGFGGTFLYQPSSTYSSTSLIVGHTGESVRSCLEFMPIYTFSGIIFNLVLTVLFQNERIVDLLETRVDSSYRRLCVINKQFRLILKEFFFFNIVYTSKFQNP